MADIVNLQFNADTSQLLAAQQKLQDVKDSTNTAAASAAAYNVTLDATTQAYLKANAAAINTATGLNSVADANDKAAAEAEKFLQKLSDQADKASMTKKEYLELQAAMHEVSDQAAPYISVIDQASKSHDTFSLATSGARRELIVLGHEMLNGNWTRFSGSMMVLGERTGGLGAIFSATGGAIAVAAAAIGIFADAIIKGAEESNKLNNSLVMTNDYAGLTADSMRGMITQVANAGQNIGVARQAFEQLTESGKFTSDQIQLIGTTSTQMNQAIGMSVGDSVKMFEELAKSPVAASKTLNEQYHYLTASVYEQIEALEKQGDAVGAADLAMKTAADAFNDRTKQIIDNQGYILQGWNGIKNAASAAWDAMLGIGRQQTLGDQIKALEAKKSNAAAGPDASDFANGGTGASSSWSAAEQKQLDQLKVQQRNVNDNASLKSSADAVQATGIAALDASKQFDRFGKNADTAAEKIKQFEKVRDEILKADPNSQKGLDMLNNTDSIEANIRKSYEKKSPKAKDTSNRDSQGAIELIKEQIKSLQDTEKQAEEDAKTSMDNGLSTRKQYYDTLYALRNAELEKEKPLIAQEIAASGGLNSIAAREKYAAQIAAIDDQIALNKKKNQQDDAKVDADEAKSLDTVIAAYEKKRAALMASQDKSVDTSNMSKTEKAFYSDNLSATTAHTDARNSVLSAGAKSTGLSGDDLVNEPKVKAALEKVDQDFQDSLNRNRQVNQERIASDNDWLGGLINGMTDVAGKNATMYDTMKSYGQSVTQDLTTAFTNFVATGKMSFRSLILDMIQQLEKLMVQKGITMLLSFMGGSAGAGAAAVGGNSYGFTMPTAQAQGGAWSQGVQMFAQGGVVTNPTSFGTATGSGLMGEAGPEAIMPLKRASDGSLGVTVSGMSSTSSSTTGGDTYNVTVNVQGGNNPQQTGSIVSEAVLKQMQAISRNEIAKANRPGGQNNSLVLGNTK